MTNASTRLLITSAALIAACSDDAGTGPDPVTLTAYASQEIITTPGVVLVTAEASGPLDRVEIWDGETKVAESIGAALVHTVQVPVTADDNGSRAYTVEGFAGGRAVEATGGDVIVEVDIRWDMFRPVERGEWEAMQGFAIAPSGDIYIAGHHYLRDPPVPSTDAVIWRIGPTGGTVWRRTFAGPEWEAATSVSVDPSGRVHVSGVIASVELKTSDCFLLEYDEGGNIVRNHQIVTSQRESSCFSARDAAGNVYLAGDVTEHNPDGSGKRTDVFVAKCDPQGNLLWMREYGSAPGAWSDDYLAGIALDAFGGVYVTGYTSGGVNGYPNLGANPDDPYSRDIFVLKYGATGALLWEHAVGTPVSDFPSAIAADPRGGVFITGEVGRAPGGGLNSPSINGIITRYGADGTWDWYHLIDGGGYDAVRHLAVDANAVHVVGTINAGELSSERRQGPSDAFLASLSHDGAQQWMRLLGGPGHDGAFGVLLDPTGDLHVILGTTGGLPGAADAGTVIARHRMPAP